MKKYGPIIDEQAGLLTILPTDGRGEYGQHPSETGGRRVCDESWRHYTAYCKILEGGMERVRNVLWILSMAFMLLLWVQTEWHPFGLWALKNDPKDAPKPVLTLQN